MPFLGAIGAAVGAGVAGSMTAIVVGGAIVGAVVGGLVAAVSGGNILEGILFGAIGGAVLGGVAGWAAPGFMGVSGATSTAAATGGGFSAGSAASAATQLAAAESAAGVATSAQMTASGGAGLFGGLTADAASLGAVASGIKGLGDMYLEGEKMEALAKEADLNRAFTADQAEKDRASAELRTSISAGGAAAADRRSDESYSEVARINAEGAIAKQEAANRGSLASTELQVADNAAARTSEAEASQRGLDLASGGSAVAAGGSGASRSTESLTDIQDRIRSGEGPDGAVDTSVIPEVQYALA